MLNAADIMTEGVIVVHRETPVDEIARTLVRHRISALPVVDTEKRVLGIISEGDLLRRVELGTDHHPSGWQALFASREELAHDYVKSHGRTAADLMTAPVHTVAPTTTLTDIIDTLERHKVKRVPVVQDERLVGIVSRANLVQALVAHRGKIDVDVSSDDRSLRDSLVAQLRQEDWFNPGEINVMVVDQVVQLWGIVYSDEERHALCLAAEAMAGVRGVEDHLAMASAIGYT